MEVRELVEYIKGVKQKREELETAMEEKRNEEKELKAIADAKQDKTSGFYQDAETARQEKHKEWIEVFNKREKYRKDSDKDIENMKLELIEELEEKAKAVDENRNLTKQQRENKVNNKYKEVQELNSRLYSKKQELKYFETTLPNDNKDKKAILTKKKEEIENIDKQIKNDIGVIKAIESEEPEKAYNVIKNEIEYIKQLSVDNVEKGVKTDSKTNPTKTEPTKTEPTKTEPTKAEPTKTEPTKAEPTKTEPTKTEPTKTEPTKTEPTKTEPTKAEPTKTEPTKTEPTEDNDIYSNSFIHINAAKGEAEVYLSSVDGKQVIGNISDIIENRKSKFERLDVNGRLEKFGVESRFNKFIMRRKINPVILEAIQEDEKLTDKYIESVVNNEKFPFNYKLDLENSSLPSKETNFMNRLALKESKIEGNEIIGAEKLHTIKNIFRSIKNKGQKRFKKQENQKSFPVAKEKNRLGDELKRQLEEQNKRYDEAYTSLTKEQKENLKDMNVSDLQRLGIDYTTACGVLDKYITSENEQKSKSGEKEKTEGNQEKQSEQKEGDEQTV